MFIENYNNLIANAEKEVRAWFEAELAKVKASGVEFGKTVFKVNDKGDKAQIFSYEELIEGLKIEHPFNFKLELRGYKLNQNGEPTHSVRKIDLTTHTIVK